MSATIPTSALDDFRRRISAWIDIGQFQLEFDHLLEKRNAEEFAAYMRSQGPWKAVKEEVAPISDYLRFRGIANGWIRFALGNEVPDCIICADGAEPIGIEVTLCLGKEQHYLGAERAKGRVMPGFLGLQDSASKKRFEEKIRGRRMMHSPAGAMAAIRAGVEACLMRKNNPKFAGHHLVISAPTRILSKERSSSIQRDLSAFAHTLPFAEVYVVQSANFGIRLK